MRTITLFVGDTFERGSAQYKETAVVVAILENSCKSIYTGYGRMRLVSERHDYFYLTGWTKVINETL